jgi:hypothetical protein
VPPAFVLIPPAVMVAPTLFPSFMQFAAFVIGLLAVAAVMFYRFMQFVLGMLDSSLAALVNVFLRLCERPRHRQWCDQRRSHAQ